MIGGAVSCRNFSGGAGPEEQSAKAELGKLGALVVMDSQREHVAGVTLATLQSPEKLSQAIKLLPALTHVNSINADSTALNDEHLAEIAKLSRVHDLVLSNTKVTDAGIAQLQSLKNLQSLHLAETAVSNAGLTTIGGLASLTIVDLSGTKVSGNFEPLRNLAKLNWLVLRKLSLDAAAIASLADCKSLRRLSLNDANCPPEAVAALRQQRPDLTIDH